MIESRGLVLNKKGYLEHFEDWNRDSASAIAEGDGLTLNDAHWQVIAFLREYYSTHEMPPNPRVIVKAIGHSISAHVPWTRKHLDELFPAGGCAQACRIAGLPDYYYHGC